MRNIFRGKIRFALAAALIINMSFVPALAADAAPRAHVPGGLAIAQIKMTGDEFVVLTNGAADAIDDLSAYWLYAFNKTSPVEPGASSSGQQLPVGSLGAGQTLLLSDKARPTCGARIAGSLSLSFGDGNGYLQLMKQSMQAGTLVETPADALSWGTDAAAMGVIPKVPSNGSDPDGMYYRSDETPSGWQLADLDVLSPCRLNVVAAGASQQSAIMLTAGGTEPPATIIGVTAAGANSDGPGLPAADAGLSSPVITELLPNPAGTGNDETDEFIELYNPNPVAFDLSGFALQAGTAATHTYVFPGGTHLPAGRFMAFYAADTGLSLSNSGGAAALLDPFGNILGHSDTYGAAKDGMAWALAKGTWYWSSQITPGAANVVQQVTPNSKKPGKTGGSKSSASKAVKGASTAAAGAPLGQSPAQTAAVSVTPIHPWTLALVASLAVAYGLYEYRYDLANRLHQLRRNRAARREPRQSA